MRDAAEGIRTALRTVLRDHGRRVSEDPNRFRALLVDALGPGAGAARAELDAVVLAVEEAVPAALDGSRAAAEAARRRLRERGLSTAMADFAVDCWETVLVDDPRARTSGTGSSTTVPGQPLRPATRPGPRAAARADQVAATEIPLPAAPRSASEATPQPGAAHGVGAPAQAAGGQVAPTRTSAGVPTTRWPPVLALSRSRTVVAAVASLSLAFGVGFLGSDLVGNGDTDGGDRTTSLVAGPVSTPATVTSTSVVRVTTTRTRAVTKSVTSTVTVDPSKLKAVSDRFTTQPYVVWAGNRTCALKAPAKATRVRACYGIYRVRATGTQKSWKVLSASVTGRGKVVPAGKDINYTYVANGPSTTTISFVIGAGSYRSKGTLRIQLECNRSLGCGKALP